jgi:hypothetical protein
MAFMCKTSSGLLREAAAICFLGLVGLWSPVRAEDSGPFAMLAGSWSGSGTVSVSNGTNERIRCNANYDVLNPNNVQLSLRCASDSYNFNLLSAISNQGGAISGSWTEATRNTAGHLTGRVNGSQIQVAAKGGSFTADLTVQTRGDHQSVTIRSTGADVTGASITMTRK